MLCAKFYNDHYDRIWMRAKQICHQIWIVMKKSLVQWVQLLFTAYYYVGDFFAHKLLYHYFFVVLAIIEAIV